jgi:AcrR family transcriptional regulator
VSLAIGRAGEPAKGRELRARGRRTVRVLLDAAVEVFAERGYHAARVDDIVRVARTSHGTFYLYFANKEDLFRELVADVGSAINAHAESLGTLTPDDAGREELRRWLVGFGELYQRYAPVIRSWVEAEIETEELGQVGSDVLAGLGQVLATRIASSPHLADDPGRAALVLVAMVERANYYATVGHIRQGHEELAGTLAVAAHRSLFGAGR